ncbi:helix-turn-helix transcriptional regulator [Streptomyces sp. ISL-44]|uniref:ArsR/SmtB family transcription factor n=1 Tax=unclassified Streptomyces TaxID=2593676 RepID=UPI001BE5C3AC|nr:MULTISPECIES: helix-turn-helix domain-containing protein [unclassified Streptomyces]MBT2541215.1 helix-turn-helix transcriptional regulator [Streptomyces sp. ISL-44]MCX5014040.1 helix-turn-helix domain-containing protein [Streptomyces sp. NBC_00555]MCX5608059.1 helix-turn-helix domain-containing protein [Streptomyces sp. NBC_00047]UUU42110.1 helix-turn-helix domain-containing protein [Streptomyces sp. NBC_00162]
MLRIHFTGVDLARVRMAGRPDALWETILSFHRLRDRRDARLFGEWRTETRSRLNSETRMLGMLIPARGYFPDFLTPVEGQYGWDVALDALRGIRPERMRRELVLLGGGSGAGAGAGAVAGTSPAPRLREFMDGGTKHLPRLLGELRGYHRAAVEPYWTHIQAQIEAERAARGRALLDGGADELLASLPPMLRWRAPVLECDYPVDRDVRLRGRGLLLQPSFFCRRTAVTLHDPELPPVLVYPAASHLASAPTGGEAARTVHVEEQRQRTLGKLVGHTRSVVLRAIGDGATTSELARRAGVSLASASQHACVMREAGLVTTLRHGNAVLHTVTPLGAALLKGGAVAS